MSLEGRNITEYLPKAEGFDPRITAAMDPYSTQDLIEQLMYDGE